MNSALKYLHRLAAADIAFWIMPPLMALLVAGTIAQKYMGLWPAIDHFFGGFILWAGPVPLPGAYTLLGLLTLSLTLKFILKSEWRARKIGIHLAHLGTLVLLIGGLLTAITAHESYMIIPEGETSAYIYSYTERELAVYEGEELIKTLRFDDINQWSSQRLPFDLNILKFCKNCEILKREETSENLKTMAAFMTVSDKSLEAEPERNLSGIEFEITGTDDDGHYIAFDGMPKPITVPKDGQTYTLIFGKAQNILDFSITLEDFVKQDYGGTNIAKSYHSDIILHDGNVNWPVRIEMNEPLRYKGYTFFQSSFEETPDKDATILAVVENKGWIFPYIGSALIGFGLLLHFFMITIKRKQEHAS